jgi:hypothetical protein
MTEHNTPSHLEHFHPQNDKVVDEPRLQINMPPAPIKLFEENRISIAQALDERYGIDGWWRIDDEANGLVYIIVVVHDKPVTDERELTLSEQQHYKNILKIYEDILIQPQAGSRLDIKL